MHLKNLINEHNKKNIYINIIPSVLLLDDAIKNYWINHWLAINKKKIELFNLVFHYKNKNNNKNEPKSQL